MENYGQIIKKIRKSKKMTQAECAKKAKISLMSYRRYENGEREPTIGVLQQIAFALGVAITELIGLSVNLQNELDIAQYVHDFPDAHIDYVSPEDADIYEKAKHLPKPEALPEDIQSLKKSINKLGYNVEKVNGNYFMTVDGGFEVTEDDLRQLEKLTGDFLKFQCQQLEEKHKPDFMKNGSASKD